MIAMKDQRSKLSSVYSIRDLDVCKEQNRCICFKTFNLPPNLVLNLKNLTSVFLGIWSRGGGRRTCSCACKPIIPVAQAIHSGGRADNFQGGPLPPKRTPAHFGKRIYPLSGGFV